MKTIALITLFHALFLTTSFAEQTLEQRSLEQRSWEQRSLEHQRLEQQILDKRSSDERSLEQRSLEQMFGVDKIDVPSIPSLLLSWMLSIYAPTTAADRVCSNHSEQYAEGVKNMQLWAVQMFDASTKMPDGIIAGNINQMGNFDECLAATDPGGGFTGKHCYALLYPSTTRTTSTSQTETHVAQIVDAYRQAAALRAGHGDAQKSGIDSVPAGVGIRWSFCVPSTCPSDDIANHLSARLAFLGVAASVDDAFCHTRDAVPLRPIDWAAISILIVIVVLAVLSTTYDVIVTDPDSRCETLLAFSVYSNGARLLDTRMLGSDTLGAVNGVRFLSICWVAYCHRWALASIYPSPALAFALDFVKNPVRMIVVNGYLSVDSFFLISGMLLCYIFLKEMDKGVKFNLPLFYIHRYIRLTPPVAMMILLQVSLLALVGTGPVWDYTMWYVRACEKNWWVTLLYVHNYVNSGDTCIAQTWYLAVDMQLYILSPLLLIPLWKLHKYGKYILGSCVAVGLAVSFTLPYVEENHANNQQGMSKTHNRFTVWLIGIGLGYLLHHTKGKPFKLNKWLVSCSWLLALFLTFGSVYLLAPFKQPDYEYNKFLDALYIAYYRPAFAVGLGWVIFACARGYGGFINTALSWSVFVPLARLSYCIYLVHMAVQVSFLGAIKTPMYFHDSVVVPQFFADMVMSTGFAALLYLFVEAPFINIEKVLFRRGSSKQHKQVKDVTQSAASAFDKKEVKSEDVNVDLLELGINEKLAENN